MEITGYEDKTCFMAGVGISYVWNNDLKIGFSMPELFKTENEFYPTFFANVSYKYDLASISKFYLEPSLLLYTTDLTPITFEGALKVGYKEFAWVKIGGKSSKTLIFGAGLGYSIINVGYIYNKNFDTYQHINESQHNINTVLS